jgi:hypothetical protein
MCGNRRTVSLGFTSQQCLEGTHICYIYSNETERMRVISRYLCGRMLDTLKDFHNSAVDREGYAGARAAGEPA